VSEESVTYTVAKVSKILGVTSKCITNNMKEGKIPYITVGRRKMMLKKDLEEILISKKSID